MALPILKVNLRQIHNNDGTLGYDYIVESLVNSKLFEIQDHKDAITPMKGSRATILYFNDKKIYLDFWEYATPTHTNEAVSANFDLVIKLQDKNTTPESYLSYIRHKKMLTSSTDRDLKLFWNKIVPWTFFPSKNMMPYVGKEDELVHLPIERLGFFCGFNWKARHSMKRKLESENIEYLCTEKSGRMPDKDFINRMLSSKFGIVLPGRNTAITDAKNRREVDYMMMKKPLLISYKPYYYDPFVDGVHYIHVNEKTDFKSLDKMYNINEIAENGFQWYKRNASPQGIATSFLKIMSDKGYL